MYDYKGKHVGKDLFRSKKHEEDIVVVNEITNAEIPISLKAYGDGPLQLSTDKDSGLFELLKSKGTLITNKEEVLTIFKSKEFQEIMSINVMPLIYREKEKRCNILIFDYAKVIENTTKIQLIEGQQNISGQGKRRTHPIFAFFDKSDEYICEVRYGGKTANALQRGFWTNTKRAKNYFHSATNGWIEYQHNEEVIRLIRLALNATKQGHFVSYLSAFSPRSYNELKLEVPNYQLYEKQHIVLKGDIFDVIKNKEFDLAYFDPPYGSNNEKMPPSRVRYAAYYHFWTSVICFDRPNLFGKVNRREEEISLLALFLKSIKK